MRRSAVWCALFGAVPMCLAATLATAAVELETVQVTATRLPESVRMVPAALTVIDGNELRARHVQDLRGALALVGGVEVSMGGDGGPASAVPAFYGFREFDAFLLVVDGVPAGGAFNPTLAMVDLHNVMRIEVLRGAAPVMYGATSFVGVIHIIHFPAGESSNIAEAVVGSSDGNSYGSAAVSTTIGDGGDDLRQSLSADGGRDRTSDQRASANRAHLAYRVAASLGAGQARADVELTDLRQVPQGTVRRENIGGGVQGLTRKTPIDSNHNPSDAEIDEQRVHIAGGYDLAVGIGDWSSTLAFTRSDSDHVRGWLFDQNGVNPNAANAKGFIQDREVVDVYVDSHLSNQTAALDWVIGFDYLYGNADVDSTSLNYYADRVTGAAGSARSIARTAAANPAGATSIGRTAVVSQDDTRDFAGLYVQGDWHAAETLDVLVGLRLNHTRESQNAFDATFNARSHAQMTKTRPSGTVGVAWQAWQSDSNYLTLYTDYRDSYKPFAFTFTPKSRQQIEGSNGDRPLTPAERTFSAEIYAPETAESAEIGLRGALFDQALHFEVAAHTMDFEGLTWKSFPNGGFYTGSHRAGGEIEFRGVETEFEYHFTPAFWIAGNFAHQHADFGEFNTDDGTSVTGNRLEMSPIDTAAVGVFWHPQHGFNASVLGNHVGGRFLNKKNTGPIDGYDTLEAHLGWQGEEWSFSLDGANLTDRHDAISESEYSESVAGAASYYRLPGRSLWLTVAHSL